MSYENLISLNPYDRNHIKLFKEMEEENNVESETLRELEKISHTITEEEYDKRIKHSNEIMRILMIEQKSKIIDYYYIHGEKDIKTCHISFSKIKKAKNKRIISMIINYVMINLGMEEIFIEVPKKDKNVINILEAEELENLGEENNKILYLKEKEETLQRNQNEIIK